MDQLLRQFGVQALRQTVECGSPETLEEAAASHGLEDALREEEKVHAPLAPPVVRKETKKKKVAPKRRVTETQLEVLRRQQPIPDPSTQAKSETKRYLELDWVHGIDVGAKARILATSGDCVLWYSDNVVVVFARGKQRFFKAHRHRVSCISVHEKLCASGEACAQPCVMLWNIHTLEVLFRLGDGFFKSRVSAVILSENALVGIDDGSMAVGYWQLDDLRTSQRLVDDRSNSSNAGERAAHWGGLSGFDHHVERLSDAARRPHAEQRADAHRPASGNGSILDACWHHGTSAYSFEEQDEEVVATLVTVGPKRHVRFWLYNSESKTLLVKPGIFLKESVDTMFRCAYLRSSKILLTLGGGCVYAWRGRVMFAVYDSSCQISALGGAFASEYLVGSKQSGVRALVPRGTKPPDLIDDETTLPPTEGTVRDVCRAVDGTIVAVTSRCVVWAIKHSKEPTVIMSAPPSERTVCCMLSTNLVATVGNGCLCIFNVARRQIERCRQLRQKNATCIAGCIGVGFEEGLVIVYDMETLDERFAIDCSSPIVALAAYESSGRFAAGGRDGSISVFSSPKKKMTAKVCSSRILDIDFDASGCRIRASTRAKELVWLDAKSLVHLGQASSEGDWGPTQTARIAFRQRSSSHFNAETNTLAVVDGTSLKIEGPRTAAAAYHQASTMVRWVDENTLITCGRHSLFQWRLAVISDNNKKQPSRSPQHAKAKIRLALCHLCGRFNPASGFARHLAACEKRWRDDQENNDRPLPPIPDCVDDLRDNFGQLSQDAIDNLNRKAQLFYLNYVMVKCDHCGRTFSTRSALAKHNVVCTDERVRPFKS